MPISIASVPLDQRLPAFAERLGGGIVVAETEGFDAGDGARATLMAHELIVDICTEDASGRLVIPIVTLLAAIQEQTAVHES